MCGSVFLKGPRPGVDLPKKKGTAVSFNGTLSVTGKNKRELPTFPKNGRSTVAPTVST